MKKNLKKNISPDIAKCPPEQREHQQTQRCIFFWFGCVSGTSSKEPTCQCRRLERFDPRFDPWVGKIP